MFLSGARSLYSCRRIYGACIGDPLKFEDSESALKCLGGKSKEYGTTELSPAKHFTISREETK